MGKGQKDGNTGMTKDGEKKPRDESKPDFGKDGNADWTKDGAKPEQPQDGSKPDFEKDDKTNWTKNGDKTRKPTDDSKPQKPVDQSKADFGKSQNEKTSVYGVKGAEDQATNSDGVVDKNAAASLTGTSSGENDNDTYLISGIVGGLVLDIALISYYFYFT